MANPVRTMVTAFTRGLPIEAHPSYTERGDVLDLGSDIVVLHIEVGEFTLDLHVEGPNPEAQMRRLGRSIMQSAAQIEAWRVNLPTEPLPLEPEGQSVPVDPFLPVRREALPGEVPF